MQGTTTPARQESSASSSPATDVFVARFANPHTAIPDWLILGSFIRLEIRHMAAVIIIMSKRPEPPSKADIAEVLSVNTRTVSRWLAELRTAGCMEYQQVGRRRMYVFHDPTIIDRSANDRMTINDRMAINDPTINDPSDTHGAKNGSPNRGIRAAMNRHFNQNPIIDRSGGGGESGSPENRNPPSTNPPPRTKVLPTQIVGATGRWMVREGFNISSAYRFQSLPLEVAQADYARRRDLGQHHGAVVQAWTVELPEFDHLGDDQAAIVSEARRAELRAKYGDLFSFSGDMPASGGE